MRHMNGAKKQWTKESLIAKFKDICKKENKQITRQDWTSRKDTPSDMPIRCNFKTWNNFIVACGFKIKKPTISALARKNTIKAHKGKRSFNWKGGRIKDKHGYVLIWKPEHPNCKTAGYIHEHRFVMSEYLNRPLNREENVHHKNGIRDDNRLENLELWTRSQPYGQRQEDLIEYYKKFLEENGYSVVKNILQ